MPLQFAEKLYCLEGRRYTSATGGWCDDNFYSFVHTKRSCLYITSTLQLVTWSQPPFLWLTSGVNCYSECCWVLLLGLPYLSSVAFTRWAYVEMLIVKYYYSMLCFPTVYELWRSWISSCLTCFKCLNDDECRSVNKVHEEWFADEERVRKSAGLLEKPVVPLSRVKEVCSLLCYRDWFTF